MFATILSLFSLTTWKEWFWAGLVVAVGILGLHIYNDGVNHEKVAVAAASSAAEAKAIKQNAATQATYVAQVNTITETSSAQLETATAQHDSDVERVRDFDSYRSIHAAVAPTSSGPAPVSAGVPSGDSDSERLSSLEDVALQLAGAAADSDIALRACIKDRDALTGK